MPLWNYAQLQSHIKKKSFSSVYGLISEEYFLLEHVINEFKTTLLDSESIEFNYQSFYAGEDNLSQIRKAVEMYPLLHPKRLVVLHQAHQLKERDWDQLTPLLEKPISTTVLIITTEKIDKRKKSYKTLEKNGVLAELKKPFNNQLAPWIETMAKNLNLTIAPEASQILAHLIGNELTQIQQALIKLKCYLDDENHITTHDVLFLVSQSKQENVFDFTKSLGNQDLTTAFFSLNKLQSQGENVLGTLAMTVRHFRILLSLQLEKEKGVPHKVSLPSIFLKDYQSQMRHWSLKKLAHVFLILKQTDRDLKTTGLQNRNLMENLVLKICKV
ncbi:MAG: DNA polymerase III subunit delta [Bdellovibrionales bacterium]|nr:DNA polymerase III subunit delta [Bdellovibrionales bacterium]